MNVQQKIELMQQKLKILEPTLLEIKDESALHVGHPGNINGTGHYALVICSEKFKSKKLLACHQMIYAALGNLVGKEIHALRIKIVYPDG